MANYKKGQLLDILETLKRANNSIENAQKDKENEVIDALGQCQELAVNIGEDIETRGEAGEAIVEILEEYCEDLYQISISFQDENLRKKLTKKIRKQLMKVSNGIRFELPEDKKEVVFLPYKASMWDSLESVWMAAKDDVDCEAYVIPIPYFDKNPDGSFGEMHYEGDEYPDYVPITSWEEYDIAGRKPDVIYIHNPYDSWNYVTSVHPAFYASELRNYTDMLVYIPYFIMQEISPDDQEAVDGVKHFCFMPGTIYADKVIVQSENIRQIYINEYIKAAKEADLKVEKKAVEQKFLGTGSPKIQKILNTKKEDLYIPAEWKKVIEKEDGTRKDIILYNTSLGTLLRYGDKYLDKLENVLGIFKHQKESIALLWRPHPLLLATIKSMRPNLETRYMSIVEQYREERWGIYDDSSDLTRAIVISDIYYGDSSSLVDLYVVTGKALKIQNIETLNEEFIELKEID